jgi:hypothetical protein
MEGEGLLQVFADSLQEETLPTAEITQFLRGVHKWDADLPQHQFERYSQDINALYKSFREKNTNLHNLSCLLKNSMNKKFQDLNFKSFTKYQLRIEYKLDID